MGVTAALGCEPVPALSPGRESGSGQGMPGLAWGKELGSAVAVHSSEHGMLLRA